MDTLKKLVQALFNATIMLLIILAVAGIVLLNRVEHLADVVHDELAPQVEKLDRIAEGVEAIETELAEAGENADLAAIAADILILRSQLTEVTARMKALGNITARGLAEQVGAAIAKQLEPDAAPAVSP